VLTEQRRQLERVFRQQQQFADGYSPLYAQLFGVVAGWLAGDAADPLIDWLTGATAGVRPFDVTLLLPAALHRDVLAGEPAAAELARFYPTADGRPTTAASSNQWSSLEEERVVGDQSPEVSELVISSGRQELPSSLVTPSAIGGRRTEDGSLRSAVDFPAALRSTILARREALAAFIRGRSVQTNETGRGLVWLLPVACLGWPAVHLVELGASAGLNLVAERRGYRLADAGDPSHTLLTLGDGPPQFTTLARGAVEIPPLACCPAVLSRTGGDLNPFYLRDVGDELTLASFVWADQVERLARLREGIAALRAVEGTPAPVRLRPLRLPDELPGFLARELPRPLDAPVVIFNTTVTMYLPEGGAILRRMVAEWAVGQHAPVLWLQWELPGDARPPQPDWLVWTADYWPNDGASQSRRWLLAWVHPHGGALEWGPDWGDFLIDLTG
jgi:hypothetical protein